MNKYQIIYADPPWQYNDTKAHDPAMGGILYDTMSTQALCRLPIQSIAANNCALLLSDVILYVHSNLLISAS